MIEPRYEIAFVRNEEWHEARLRVADGNQGQVLYAPVGRGKSRDGAALDLADQLRQVSLEIMQEALRGTR